MKVMVTINRLPNMLYNNGIKSQDMWAQISCFFVKEKSKTEHMTHEKFYTSNEFRLLIDLYSLAD